MSRDVIIVLESSETINKGLLSEGSRIADLLGGNLTALITEPSTYSFSAWIQAAKNLLEKTPFRVLLFAHTNSGAELAPLFAHALDTPAVTDCFDIRYKSGVLYYAKAVHGGQFEQEVSFTSSPEIVSLNVEALEAKTGFPIASVPLKQVKLQILEISDSRKILQTISPDYKTIDIRYAQRILDIGAGCNQPKLLAQAEELSDLLEASIGTTRLVVDSGSFPKTRMLGQTGKTSAPHLCLALGVSGSPHHIPGICKAAQIFAINSDERAPIFGVSDAGFYADLNSFLPKLIDRIKQYRDKDRT